MLPEIFLLLFLILLIVQVAFFVKAIRLKSNKYWIILFTIIISSGFNFFGESPVAIEIYCN